jgi:hypothetical protein
MNSIRCAIIKSDIHNPLCALPNLIALSDIHQQHKFLPK